MVVVTNIFTKVQQLWNAGDFVVAVASMRAVYQRLKVRASQQQQQQQ
jgi:hypothetical protein